MDAIITDMQGMITNMLTVINHTTSITSTSKLWLPNVNDDYETKNLDELDKEVEAAVHEGKVIVVNCALLACYSRATQVIERIGVIPLRWGAPRLILATPTQARALANGEELARVWRLWRYQFDPKADAYSLGSPNLIDQKLYHNQANGKPWDDGIHIVKS